ncbi:hypothetical protein JVU11DRAFT_8652 [Chiua virens]|nr:hypothetical protein JVU11DRAFT_8652 [Chiua virens]
MSSPVNPLTGTALDPTNLSYTALVATLVLLLSVSSAIVIRSLILRRRHQRLVEEAIRTGTWMPQRFDTSTGRRRRDIGQKPKLWEAWLHANHGDGEGEDNEKSQWGDITPFYAAYINPSTSSLQGPTPTPAENPVDPSSRSPRFIRPFTRRRSPPSPQPTTAVPTADPVPSLPSSSPTATTTPAVRVAVLIAMPNASPKHISDENGPPLVEIGIVEAAVKDDETDTSSHEGSS